MHVVCTLIRSEGHVIVGGRTDYPDCGDFTKVIRPGESFCGLSFDELTTLSGFDTDPATGKVTSTILDVPSDSNLPIPDWLRKK